ncbi:hypothetical protein IFR04_014100 [Cadophora malorum]|uniref:Uncharacterized protein n=1 Tax=Cadophora malorum TaxID=108018 RepID=A0A8H7T056_9HELO|nr:hypothetical protein IFR04_014100 [Cadophora malorum]
MSSIESLPPILPSIRGSTSVEVARLNERNATLRMQRNYLIDYCAMKYKDPRNTSEMLANLLPREITEQISKQFNSKNGVLNDSGIFSGESIDIYEKISKMLEEERVDFVVDLDDDEVSLHRPDIQAPGNASATLNLAKIGVIASKAAGFNSADPASEEYAGLYEEDKAEWRRHKRVASRILRRHAEAMENPADGDETYKTPSKKARSSTRTTTSKNY